MLLLTICLNVNHAKLGPNFLSRALLLQLMY